MAEQAADPLAAGDAALTSGDWAVARAAFEAALEEADAPAAREGLARALWWTHGPARAISERSRAYSGYRREGDDRAAAHVALWIAHEYEASFGNSAAAAGWLARHWVAGAASRGSGPRSPGARAQRAGMRPVAGWPPREGGFQDTRSSGGWVIPT
jgi:hypothetical protein